MNEQRIAIITDSGTDTPAAFVRAHDIRVVPLLISYPGEKTYKSGVDISTQDVIDRLANKDAPLPKTSLPAPTQVQAAFEKAQADGYTSALFISISAALSGTNEMATFVGNEMQNFPVMVIDTKSIGLIAGMMVMEATRLAESGKNLAEITAALTTLAEKSSIFFTTKTLYYLRQGGRISEAVYRLGKVLNLKPVITCDKHGYYAVVKKARGWKKALLSEVALVQEEAQRFDQVRVGICCTQADDFFDELEEQLRKAVPNVLEVVRSGISPDLIVHSGPDLVGMGVVPVTY